MPSDSTNQPSPLPIPNAAPSSGNRQPSCEPVPTETLMPVDDLSAAGKEQLRQLKLLDANQKSLALLFAGLPTFDSVINNLLVSSIKKKIPERKLRPSLLEHIDPDHCYVNHFAIDSNGGRTLTHSQSFTDVMRSSLKTDTPPTYTAGGVGFYIRPDTVDEADSIFSSPADSKILQAMASAFYIAGPTTNETVRQQLRDDLSLFRNSERWAGVLDRADSSTVQAVFAHLLSRRFLHLCDLYKADRKPAASAGERTQRAEDDRLLDIISTHPSMLDRGRLQRAPIPHVYAVMLDTGRATPQQWPAAMVIKQTERQRLFLYSLEGGLQRFPSFEAMTAAVSPLYDGQARTILNISSELSGHVFEVAASDLFQRQSAALEKFLSTPIDGTMALEAFAQQAEEALSLPVLSLSGPLAVRRLTRVENNRPVFYASATPSEQATYRRLEAQVFQGVYELSGRVQTLVQFTQEKIKQYLKQTLHPAIKPDPERTQVTLSFGNKANPRQSRTISLTQLMLDNLRSPDYPEAMSEVSTVYLVDQHCQRIRHPDNDVLITLTGSELARMAKSLDVGGNYEILLREEMNKPHYKAVWQAAYLANLKFKGYEAGLRGDSVFKATGLDTTANPSKLQKRVLLWLAVVLKSPVAEARAQVFGRRVHVHGLLLGGSVGAGGQHGTMGNALSVDGALIFTDQLGPEINGPVGVYFPDSPDGDDFQEFSDLGEGVGELLLQEKWQAYFRSRISAPDADELKGSSAQRRGRPLIRGCLITGDLLETLHRAYVNFHSAHADHLSNSNLDVRRHHAARVFMVTVDILLEVAGVLAVPGVQLLKRAVRTGSFVLRSGVVPRDLDTLVFIDKVANRLGQGRAHGWTFPSRGQASFLAVKARQHADEALAGLPLEDAIYHRYAVKDTVPIRGLAPDAQGFYRPRLNNDGTAQVYVRQPDGTVFRVHDHTKMTATEATIVDPLTGLNIRSSGVMRSTVARMPNGEWRAVGFGQGGGKRPSRTPPPSGPSKPKVPALTDPGIADAVRTLGNWDNEVMDLVPSIITRVPSWPQNRSLLIIDEMSAGRAWSVRYTPGRDERIYPSSVHPDRASTDVVLRRTGQNHYSLVLGNRVMEIPANGDCFFNAVARGLNDGRLQGDFSIRGLRDVAADYIDQHPEIHDYLAPQVSGIRRALVDNAPMLEQLLGKAAVLDLAQIIHGGPNPHHLFQPIMKYLRSYAEASMRDYLKQARSAMLPSEMLQRITRHFSPRTPGQLIQSDFPFYLVNEDDLIKFFDDILLDPVVEKEILELMNNEYLMLSQDVLHIMLEYGLLARDLTDFHPRNLMAYIRFDPALHGEMSEEQLDELVGNAYLIDRDDLKDVQRRLERETGKFVNDDARLMDQYIYYDRAEDLADLLRAALIRFPDLLTRAETVLQSPVIASNLGGMLPLSIMSQWIRDPSLTDERLRLIAAYTTTRYTEVVITGDIDVSWMRAFDDDNVRDIIFHQQTLVNFMRLSGGVRGNLMDSDLPAVARLFSTPGNPPSNSRVALLLQTPAVWSSIHNMAGITAEGARSLWDDLIGVQYSDDLIRETLQRPGSLASESAFAGTLVDSLLNEEARAHQLLLETYAVSHGEAQQLLRRFRFSGNRAEHSRLSFARYLSHHGKIPEWAWQYANEGVTPESLGRFLAKRRPPQAK